MAYSSLDPTTGAPVFLDADAPDPAVNPSQVASYAAQVGTRLIGSTAERTAYSYAREGLEWFDTTVGIVYRHDGSGWNPVPGLVRSDVVSNQALLLGTSAAAITGLQITGAPTGVPCLLDVTVVSENGASGAQRFITLRAYNGATALDVAQAFSLPHGTLSGHRFTQSFVLSVTPTSGDFTVEAFADQASSVYVRGASLMLYVSP